MSELTREEIEVMQKWPFAGHEYLYAFDSPEVEKLKLTALAYLDRAERAETERDALKADLVVSRDVLRELVEAANSFTTSVTSSVGALKRFVYGDDTVRGDVRKSAERLKAAIARAEEVLG